MTDSSQTSFAEKLKSLDLFELMGLNQLSASEKQQYLETLLQNQVQIFLLKYLTQIQDPKLLSSLETALREKKDLDYLINLIQKQDDRFMQKFIEEMQVNKKSIILSYFKEMVTLLHSRAEALPNRSELTKQIEVYRTAEQYVLTEEWAKLKELFAEKRA